MDTKKNKNLGELSEKEEKVLRMKNGIPIDDDFLPRKTKDPILLAQLLDLERALLARHKKG